MNVDWGIPGTKHPEHCNIFELMQREAAGKPVSSSEMVISYHFLDEDLAKEISEHVLTPQEATIFNQIRAIPPTRFQTPRSWWQFWIKREKVTWLHYVEAIDLDTDTFWEIWDGVGGRIEDYLQARQQTA